MLSFDSTLQTHETESHSEQPLASFSDKHYLNILQSMGQSAYIYDLNATIIFWNRNAEKLYGYTVLEAVGHTLVELFVATQHFSFVSDIIDIVSAGETWSGEFPVKSKRGEKFMVITTHTPVYDDNGTLFGIVCISSDSRHRRETRVEPSPKQFEEDPCFYRPGESVSSKLNLRHPPPFSVPSNLSDSASKASNNVETKMEHVDDTTSSHVNNPRENTPKSVFGVFFQTETNNNNQFKSSLQKETRDGGEYKSNVKEEPEVSNFTERQYLNIYQSMGQSIHIMNSNYKIIFWNQGAVNLFGYTMAEALGSDVRDVMVDVRHHHFATDIIDRNFVGETWSGQFPVYTKTREKFVIVATNTPLYDDNGFLFGASCISTDSRTFDKSRSQPFPSRFEQDLSALSWPGSFAPATFGLDPQQPLQVSVTSKLSNLVSKVSNKVKSKMRSGENTINWKSENEYSHCGDDNMLEEIPPSVFGAFSCPGSEVHPLIKRGRDYYAREQSEGGVRMLMSQKGVSALWKGYGSESRFALHDQENESGQPNNTKKESDQLNRVPYMDKLGLWSPPSSMKRTNSTSISTNTSQSDFDCVCDSDYEISWEDLKIGEQIGQGACGSVYHGLWCGSDVAIKVFPRKSDDVIVSFRQEVSLMKRLRHPNILLFMGAITSPERLCIITEFLPRGSLFQLLHKNKSKIDWRRRVHMAFDIARGMNYLHNCIPPIVHCDLKSSNVLVDKNLNVKVGDFGLSRFRNQTFLSSKNEKGTPQWMAPEVMRAEPTNEKSDIFSFGVILWELATQKVPWDDLNPMQVIGMVGFMDRRLDIPEDVDPQWAAMIQSCWHKETRLRPTFQELTKKLKNVNRQCVLATRSTSEDLGCCAPQNSRKLEQTKKPNRTKSYLLHK